MVFSWYVGGDMSTAMAEQSQALSWSMEYVKRQSFRAGYVNSCRLR